MKSRILNFSLLLFILIISGCKDRINSTSLRNVTGGAGELMVIISKENWESETGEYIFQYLAQPQVGLPQNEPVFTVNDIPYEAFKDIFKTTRNLIITDVSNDVEKDEVIFKNDVYAYPQAVVYINAKDIIQLRKVFDENKDKILGFFIKAERDRLFLNYSKYKEREISDKTEERFGIRINVPVGFNVAEDKPDFMWIRYETGEISQGIMIYSYPYESDSTFSQNYLATKRNLITRNNIPGPSDGSFMFIEPSVPLLFNTFKKDGNYAAELRGLWKIENDFMGGPFVNLSIIDLLKKRVICLDGFVYAPSKNKRNLIRQMEAMIYSVEFTNQEDMDKINKQFIQ